MPTAETFKSKIGWIRTADELPDDEMLVLVYCAYLGDPIIAWHLAGDWWTEGMTSEKPFMVPGDVLWWHEIPELPA